jgi:hypothetical protein
VAQITRTGETTMGVRKPAADSDKKTRLKGTRPTWDQMYEVTHYLECQRDRIIGKMTFDEVLAEVKQKFPNWPILENSVLGALRARKIRCKPRAKVYSNKPGPKSREDRPGGDYYRFAREAKELAEKTGEHCHRLQTRMEEEIVKLVQRANQHFEALATYQLRLDELERQVLDLKKGLGVS